MHCLSSHPWHDLTHSIFLAALGIPQSKQKMYEGGNRGFEVVSPERTKLPLVSPVACAGQCWQDAY